MSLAGNNSAKSVLAAALALLVCASALAQNYIKNPDFEQPLGTNNWTVVYVRGGPSDFSVHDRSTIAHKDKIPGTWDGEPNYLDVYGAELSPYHDAYVEAYFKQTVPGLKVGSNYVISAWIVQFEQIYTNKVQVYMEAVGATTVATPYIYKYCNNNPSGWAKYQVVTKPNASGEIEVRLWFRKLTYTTVAWQYIRAYYDHVAVMMSGETPPAFKMVSVTPTNGATVTLKWETIINNTYDIQSSSGFGSWATLQSDMLATGTNLTFSTDADFSLRTPQLFRAASHNYVP